jgi:hypothetical protein
MLSATRQHCRTFIIILWSQTNSLHSLKENLSFSISVQPIRNQHGTPLQIQDHMSETDEKSEKDTSEYQKKGIKNNH